MTNYIKFLPIEEQKEKLNEQIKLIDTIKIKGTSEFNKQICQICLSKIIIPVKLARPLIHCDDCGSENNGICCLGCARDWLQLNIKEDFRVNRNHFVCRKEINTQLLNSKNSYTVLTDLMENLDKYFPIIIPCYCCTIKFDSRLTYYKHITSPILRKWYCKACDFSGKIEDFAYHYSNDIKNGGCKIFNNAVKINLRKR
jgi:hypothetical protein